MRALAGLALIVCGLLGLPGTTGLVVAAIGVVPLLAGLFDFCLLAPLFSGWLSGARHRAGKYPPRLVGPQ